MQKAAAELRPIYQALIKDLDDAKKAKRSARVEAATAKLNARESEARRLLERMTGKRRRMESISDDDDSSPSGSDDGDVSMESTAPTTPKAFLWNTRDILNSLK